ncbi:hypothetical protein [Bartonella florencae]|uniref:hypothetical protein n=1 Tax=Bartonella florencae TaxID=928210 RepID=UPI0005647024|nr:hypothetical protein [Bartonella florencae]
MVKIFRKYTFSSFIVAAFFLSQIVNVHANDSTNIPQKGVTDCVMEQVKATAFKVSDAMASHLPAISYGTTNEIATEGKVEKVVEPIMAMAGIVAASYGINIVATITGMVLDIMAFRSLYS